MKLLILGLLLGASISTFLSTANAALGDQVVTTSSTTAQSRKATSSGASYTVSEATDADGVLIRQYVDSNGLVFAISWKGSDLPDLQSLLGNYLTEYQSVLKSRPKTFGRRSLKVATKNIVVEGFSRQRAQGGRAYIPASLPAGFDVEDVKFNE